MRYGVLDIENVGEPWNGTLICVGWRDRAYTPADLAGEHSAALDELADPDIAKVVFTKHDHRWLRLAGYKVEGPVIDVQTMAWVVDENTDLDLATVSRLYGGGAVKDPRITTRAGAPVFRCDDGSVVPLEEAPIEQVLAYNEQDLVATEAAFLGLLRRIDFEGEDLDVYFEHDVLPLTPVLLAMETAGIPVDLDRARALRARLEGEMADLERDLHDEAELPDDFNLGSSDQLGLYLYRDTFQLKRRLPITKEQRAVLKAYAKSGTGEDARAVADLDLLPDGFEVTRVGTAYVSGVQTLKGRGFKATRFTKACIDKRGPHRHSLADGCKPSTDSKTLRIQHGDDFWVQSYLELAKRRTVVGTFLSTFEEVAHRGRIFGRFNQTGTATGRLSSSNPNLQNIPSRGALGREVRDLFVPAPGMVFIHADYGQLEPRVMAHLSGDPVLVDIFVSGEDVYLRTAEEVFNERGIDKHDPRRSLMKTYVLALSYGAGPTKLRETLALDGHFLPLHEVEETYKRLQSVYRVLFDWKEAVIDEARSIGYVDTLSGHRRRITFGPSRRGWRDKGDAGREGRQAANAKVQGSAADIVARTMVNLAAEFGNDPRIIAQVHDELLMEARRGVHLRRPDLLKRIERIATEGHGFDLTVPLSFEPRVISSWAEGKD